jgi:hypothetical protein
MASIPRQQEGNQSDVGQKLEASTPRQAHSNFVEASRRLLDVNHWHEYSGRPSAIFQLNDRHGIKVDRLAKPGDYIRIDIPGPGSATGQGYDWVIVESIDDKPNPGGEQESVIMIVRPVSSPLSGEPDVAHFFDGNATSTFRVERRGLRVVASEHGRNELPNINVNRVVDKIRNRFVAGTATSGVAAFQWSLLMKGLLKDL